MLSCDSPEKDQENITDNQKNTIGGGIPVLINVSLLTSICPIAKGYIFPTAFTPMISPKRISGKVPFSKTRPCKKRSAPPRI